MTETVYIVHLDCLTGYGHGFNECWKQLMSGVSAFRPITRFAVAEDLPQQAACFPERYGFSASEPAKDSILYLTRQLPEVPVDTPVYFSLTQGEINALENPEKKWTAEVLTEPLMRELGLRGGHRIYSGACASGNMALARAAAAIDAGFTEQILVIGCDLVSEFVYSGFASVNAMTTGTCRPYDAAHDGLLLGDAAGIVLLASERALRKYGWTPCGTIAGYGLTTDAFHAAAPDPEGSMMAKAMQLAMIMGDLSTVGGVIGHGTGTVLNDSMEIAAMQKLFPDPMPLASVKGGTGHLLAASGLIQLGCAVKALEEKCLFPQTNLITPQPGAEKYVSAQAQELRTSSLLSLNAGFGGLNAALLIKGVEK